MSEKEKILNIDDVGNINSREELYGLMETLVPYSRSGFTVSEIRSDLATSIEKNNIQLLVNDEDFGELIVSITSTNPLSFNFSTKNILNPNDLIEIKESLNTDLFHHDHQQAYLLFFLIRRFLDLNKEKPAEVKESKGVKGVFKRLFGK